MRPNTEVKANVFSKLSFWWMNSFFREGSKKKIEEDDLIQIQESDKSINVCGAIERNWRKEINQSSADRKPSLARALWKTYWIQIVIFGFVQLIEESVHVIQPVLISEIITYFSATHQISVKKAYTYAGVIVFNSIFLAVSNQYYIYRTFCLGWNLQNGLCALIYKKALRLTQKSLSQTTSGKIVNLSTSDVLNFTWFFTLVNQIWITPIQACSVIAILWLDMGNPVGYGLLTVVTLMILMLITGGIQGKIRWKTARFTDKRDHYMNEIIAGMRIIKMYTWEKPFTTLIQQIRRKEVLQYFHGSILRVITYTIDECFAKILGFVIFTVFAYNGGQLNQTTLFRAIGFFIIIRFSVAEFFGFAVETVSRCMVTVERVQEYLLLEEISDEEGQTKNQDPGDSFIDIKCFTGKWQTDDSSEKEEESANLIEKPDSSTDPTLQDISLRVNAGQLLTVIGSVGSGKSSLLSAILKELPACEGKISMSGKVTYADQTPWVFSASVRENILFGEEYDHTWYQKVVTACALTKDINSFSHGDQTLVGERGVTLSGGQKARVNLARAVYRKDASICLLDDPLSAVDAAVGNHIFQHCICGLLKDKVCILVTHQLRFLEKVDEIAMLKEGKILAFGTYSELQATSQEFHELLKEHELNEESVSSSSSSESNDDDEDNDSDQVGIRSPSVSAVEKFTYNQNNSFGADDGENTPLLKEGKKQYIDEEERLAGSVDWRVYLEYFQVGNNIALFFIVLITIAIGYALLIFCDWWIAQWAARTDHRFFYASQATNATTLAMNATFVNSGNNHISVTEESTWIWGLEIKLNLFTGLYGAIIIGAVITLMSALMLSQYVCYKSSLNMHDKMFDAVIKAPIRFFDTNPVGRILNRFTMDLAHIDEETPETFLHVFFILGYMISIVIYSVTVSYLILLFALPMFIIAGFLVNYYLKTSRDVKRLEATTHSPVVSLLTSTLQGLPTIRAYKVENSFVERFYELQDINGAAVFSYLSGEHWMGIRLDLMSAFLLAFVTFLFLSTKSLLPIQSFQVGLSLTYINALSGVLDWLMTNLATLENDMTSAERIQQYYRIEPEAEDKIEHLKPTKWPVHGAINYKDVSFAYYEGGPTILKNLSFNIKSQEKIGIIGRTGAGKSSLISALFRLAKLTGGEIYIDGIPITFLGLNDLRKVISIIPQDPVLFTGTMRYNLDPFSYYKDEELWNALEQVQLKEVVESLPLKLSSEIAESGSNFSVGQRQLVCLARAVLRKNKILVIDEATANVDLRTDRLIQLTIREKFKHCTVLTIAHRLNTIIDSDRIIVMDKGEVKEFEKPSTLLQNPKSLLSKIARKAKSSQILL